MRPSNISVFSAYVPGVSLGMRRPSGPDPVGRDYRSYRRDRHEECDEVHCSSNRRIGLQCEIRSNLRLLAIHPGSRNPDSENGPKEQAPTARCCRIGF
jgi:hypothetical protein